MKQIKFEITTEDQYLTDADIENYLEELAAEIIKNGAENLLLIPPDYTRKSSALGVVTEKLYFKLEAEIKNIDILPAVSYTHLTLPTIYSV